MCVCVCVCVYIMHTCVGLYVYVCIYVSMYACTYIQASSHNIVILITSRTHSNHDHI